MADYPCEIFGGKTPLEYAKTPLFDELAKTAYVGMLKTVDDSLKPGSDVANLAVLGYDAVKYYTGRSPLEAGSMGIDMKKTDVAVRCNLVKLSDDPDFADKTMVSYDGGDIKTEVARPLIELIEKELGDSEFKFYPGVQYRHCMVWDGGSTGLNLTPPHDITGKKIKDYLPKNEKILSLMEKSSKILPDNLSIWLWGEGTKPSLPNFTDMTGLKGSIISAVDLLKGIAKFAGMAAPTVPGVTAYIDTNFSGKANAAIEEFELGRDLVYMHIEAPDECGHRGEYENKAKALELINDLVLAPIWEYLKSAGEYRILLTADHATPLSLLTHTRDFVPFLFYRSDKEFAGVSDGFSEKTAADTGILIEPGYKIMDLLTQDDVQL
jgi:2,3-bisphosphoglycerate-independent phosphoglycerate mutase